MSTIKSYFSIRNVYYGVRISIVVSSSQFYYNRFHTQYLVCRLPTIFQSCPMRIILEMKVFATVAASFHIPFVVIPTHYLQMLNSLGFKISYCVGGRQTCTPREPCRGSTDQKRTQDFFPKGKFMLIIIY